MSKKKICMLADSAFIPTGYSNQSFNILNGLTDKYGWETHQFGHDFRGKTILPGLKFEDGHELKFTLHGSDGGAYFQNLIEYKIRELKPDCFMILLDTFMLYPWLLNKDLSGTKSIFYFPTDG